MYAIASFYGKIRDLHHFNDNMVFLKKGYGTIYLTSLRLLDIQDIAIILLL